jgi:E3 ubiquitin-protein ligase TRIP12
VPIATFVSSILSSRDHPTLVIGALQLVELLLSKMPEEYKSAFQREGVFHELEILGSRSIISSKPTDKSEDKDKDDSVAPSAEATLPRPPATAAVIAASVPGYKRLSSLSLDPEDAITYRSRIIRFKYLADDTGSSTDGTLGTLKRLAETLSLPSIVESEATTSLDSLARLFCKADSTVSSFELLQSGAVDALMKFATSRDFASMSSALFYDIRHSSVCVVDLARRQHVLFKVFNESTSGPAGTSALAILVKKLQESLTRMESYEVITVSQGLDGLSFPNQQDYNHSYIDCPQTRNEAHPPFSRANCD